MMKQEIRGEMGTFAVHVGRYSCEIYFLITFYLLTTDSGELTYTLSEAVEKIGFGKFQIRILLMVGFFTVSIFTLKTILATFKQVHKCFNIIHIIHKSLHLLNVLK